MTGQNVLGRAGVGEAHGGKRDEHLRLLHLENHAIQIGTELIEVAGMQELHADGTLDHAHEHAGFDTMTRHVGDVEAQ